MKHDAILMAAIQQLGHDRIMQPPNAALILIKITHKLAPKLEQLNGNNFLNGPLYSFLITLHVALTKNDLGLHLKFK